MKPVVVAGHVCLDITPQLPAAPSTEPGHLIDVGPFALSAGGCVGNTGEALAGLGVPARFAACVGDDDLGTVLTALLGRTGADVSGVRRLAGEATSCSIVIESAGRDRTFWHHIGANAAFDGSEIPLEGAAVLHLGYPTHLPALLADGAAALRALLLRARAAGVTISIDLAEIDPRSEAAGLPWSRLLPGLLPLVDVVSPSVDDLRSLLPGRDLAPGLWAELLVDWGAAVAMVTSGPDGLWLRAGTRERLAVAGAALGPVAEAWADADEWRAALPARVVSSTGAGDAASAGLIAAIAMGEIPAFATGLAVAAAAAKMSRGPFPAAHVIARKGEGGSAQTQQAGRNHS